MKKRYIVLIQVAVLLALVGIFIYQRVHVELYADENGKSVSIIGGADGPTSVFIAGKLGGEDTASYTSITMEEAKEIFETDGSYVILDVRRADEFAEGHIKKSGVSREEIFLTTKVWIEHYGYEECKNSIDESMRKLQVEYLDLLLLHQPFADYYGAWRALEEYYEAGKIRAIGISNFYPDRMIDIATFAALSL